MFRDDLKSGRIIFGLNNSYPASGIIESMCFGWDFVWIDGQHGQHDYRSIFQCVQASRAVGIYSVIRVPCQDAAYLGLYSDTMPSAIMVPMVNCAGDAHKAVECLKFPPLGKRSYGGRTPIDIKGREYYKSTDIALIAQIESLEALNNLESIASVNGIDVLFFGADDMKVYMGLPINTPLLKSSELLGSAEKIAGISRKMGKYCGIIATSREERKVAIELGYQVIVAGGDSSFIRELSGRKLEDIKEEGFYIGRGVTSRNACP